MIGSIRKSTILVLALAITICSCATSPQPFEYQSDREFHQGPGLFSGEDGYFTIYRQPVSVDKEPANKEWGEWKEKFYEGPSDLN
jgi:hypothetical protein